MFRAHPCTWRLLFEIGYRAIVNSHISDLRRIALNTDMLFDAVPGEKNTKEPH